MQNWFKRRATGSGGFARVGSRDRQLSTWQLNSLRFEQRLLAASVNNKPFSADAFSNLFNLFSMDTSATFDELIQLASEAPENFVVQSKHRRRLAPANPVLGGDGTTIEPKPNGTTRFLAISSSLQ